MCDVNALAQLPVLGVGINYQKSFHRLVAQTSGLVDFLELNPDALCTWQQTSGDWRLLPSARLLREFQQVAQDLPVVFHGLSLSIGSASGMNEGYLQLLDELQPQLVFPWHSEHLGFLDVITTDGGYLHAGTQLPMPFIEESITLLAPRIQRIIAAYARPFLLENTTYYLPGIAARGADEVDFLNRLCRRGGAGCGLLLDLYNFYCNARNFDFDPYHALAQLDLERVVEVHIAGGSERKGFQLDVHSNHTPEPVWDLLHWLLGRAPNVKAVVYELLEQALGTVTEKGICQNLERARFHWEQTRYSAARATLTTATDRSRHELA